MAIDLNKGATVELVKALSDDIRTLPDGTKATSAGAAVRNQVIDLKSTLQQNIYEATETMGKIGTVEAGVNKFNPDSIVTGKYMDENGVINGDANYCYTDYYIPVEEGGILLGKFGNNGDRLYFRFVTAFDKYKNPLPTKGSNIDRRSFTIQADVAYVKITILKSSYDAGSVIFTVNNTLPDYVPYEETITVYGEDELDNRIDAVTDRIDVVEGILDVPLNIKKTGTSDATLEPITLQSNISLISGVKYELKLTLEIASDVATYLHIWDEGTDTSAKSITVNAGVASKSSIFIPSSNMTVSLRLYNSNRSINYTAELKRSKSDKLDETIKVLDETLDFPMRVMREGTSEATMSAIILATGIQLAADEQYDFSLTLAGTSNQPAHLHIWNENDESVKSLSLSAGSLYKKSSYTPSADMVAKLVLYDMNRVLNYSAELIRARKNKLDVAVDDIDRLLYSPIDSFPFYVQHDLAYHPLGTIRKGYLCLSCDDGTAGLQSYTIPMLTQKNVPCTFGLWSTSSLPDESPSYSPSVILQSAEGIAAVTTAVSDLGCSVAQHGNINWTDMTEQQLNDFFNREKETFEGMGITVEGAICPSHCVNDRIRAIVGGRFKSVRAGYAGFLSSYDANNHIPGDVFNKYPNYLNGPRSNCYSYTSCNITDSDKSLEWFKYSVDYAKSANFVMIVYWHDWEFIDSWQGYQDNREKLEALIDYAKSVNIDFCTLGQIESLLT